jgi:hypothetical protein
MKTAILVAITLAAINLFAQDISAPRAIPPGISQQPNPAPAIDPATGLPFKEKTFDLDFPGATVTDFVPIVQKAAGMSLNIIIPDEYRNVMIPTLKLRNVTVPQLFVAISQASMKRDIHITGYNYGPNGQKQPQWQNVQKTYGFRTVDSPARSNSIWYFYVDEPKHP